MAAGHGGGMKPQPQLGYDFGPGGTGASPKGCELVTGSPATKKGWLLRASYKNKTQPCGLAFRLKGPSPVVWAVCIITGHGARMKDYRPIHLDPRPRPGINMHGDGAVGVPHHAQFSPFFFFFQIP